MSKITKEIVDIWMRLNDQVYGDCLCDEDEALYQAISDAIIRELEPDLCMDDPWLNDDEIRPEVEQSIVEGVMRAAKVVTTECDHAWVSRLRLNDEFEWEVSLMCAECGKAEVDC
jgi:hypothetical protein